MKNFFLITTYYFLTCLAVMAWQAEGQVTQGSLDQAKRDTSSFGKIANQTVDGDLQLCVNDGGVEKCSITITGTTGDVDFGSQNITTGGSVTADYIDANAPGATDWTALSDIEERSGFRVRGNTGTTNRIYMGTISNKGAIQGKNDSDAATDLFINPYGGDIGIGTTSPDPLSNSKINLTVSDITSGNAAFNLVGNRSADNGTIGEINFINTQTGTDTNASIRTLRHGSGGTDGGNFYIYVADTTNTLQERIVINEVGRVDTLYRDSSGSSSVVIKNLNRESTGTASSGIGMDIAWQMDDTAGTLRTAGYTGYTTTALGSGTMTSDFVVSVRAVSTITDRFKIQGSTGDTFTNDGTVSSLSDSRAKRDIKPLEDGISTLRLLSPSTFYYNGKTDLGADDGILKYGFNADDVLAVAPQYVNVQKGKLDGEEVDDLKSLSMTRFIPMMVNSIKEVDSVQGQQLALIEELSTKVENQDELIEHQAEVIQLYSHRYLDQSERIDDLEERLQAAGF